MMPVASEFEAAEVIASATSLRYSPDKFFLGVIGAEVERDKVTGERFAQGGTEVGVGDDRHVITIAGSRAGKGRSAIVPNMLRYSGSVLAIDPKGELALLTAKTRAEKLGQRVCVVDPFGTTGDALKPYLTGFNPMADFRSPVEDAALITDALVLQEGSDPHWDESARTFIEGVILEVATADRFEGKRNLVTVRDLIAEGETELTAADLPDLEGVEDMTALDVLGGLMSVSEVRAVRRAAADFFDRPDRERGSVLSTARRHLRALSFPELEASLQGESFALSDLKSSPMTVYLCLPARLMGICGRWFRLFVNLALQAMERTRLDGAAIQKTATGSPVLFVLDEFATLGHMKQIEDAAGQIAGFGVKLWPVLQDLGQLKALYKDRWETFLGNAGVLQFFGNNDLTTLEYASKRLGTTTIVQLSKSEVTRDSFDKGSTGENLSPRAVNLLEPDEVGLVFSRADALQRQLILRAGYAPMILQRAFYDKHNAFRGLVL